MTRLYEAWDGRPRMFRDLAYVWRAFDVLNRSRQTGLAPTPIPVSEIIEYGVRVVGCPEVSLELEEFIRLVQALDDAKLGHIRAAMHERQQRREQPRRGRSLGRGGDPRRDPR